MAALLSLAAKKVIMRTKRTITIALFLSLALAAPLLAGAAPPRLLALPAAGAAGGAAGSVYASGAAPEGPSPGAAPRTAAPNVASNRTGNHAANNHAANNFPAKPVISTSPAPRKSLARPLFKDTTAPQIFNISPADGAITGPSITISASYIDPAPSSGIDPSTAMIHIDNRHQFASIPTSTGISVQKSGLTDGVHKIQVFVCDNDYNCSSATWHIRVDAAAPSITNVQPTGTINTASTSIRAAFDDGSGSGVNPASAKVTIDGINSTSVCAINAGGANCAVSGLAPGSHRVAIDVSDNVGNHATKSWSFNIDLNSIGVSSQVPADGSWQRTASPFIGVSFQAAAQGIIDVSSITVELDGADVTGQATRSPAGVGLILATPLSEGTHVVRVVVSDNAGHKGESQWRFSVDTIAPKISVVSPVGNTAVKPVIKAVYADGGSGINLASVRLVLDGAAQTDAATVSANSIRYAPDAPLAPGVHTVRLTVADNAGNAQTAAWRFTVTNAPTAVPAPAGGAAGWLHRGPTGRWVNYPIFPPGVAGFGGIWIISGFSVWPHIYYLPWYDPQPATGSQKSELLISNQGAGEATVNIFVAGKERWHGSIPEGGREITDLPGAAGGPVKVVCPTGQALAVTHRVTGADFMSETAAAPQESLEPVSVLPWYEPHPGGTGDASLVIGNAGGTEAAVDVYMGNLSLPGSLKGHYSVAPNSAAIARLPVAGGPVRVICTNNQPLVIGLLATFKGSFTEILATGISRLAPDYRLNEDTGPRDQILSNKILLGNPGGEDVRVQLKVGSRLVPDRESPENGFFAVAAGSSRSVQLAPGDDSQIEVSCPGCRFGEGVAVEREIVRNNSLSYLAGVCPAVQP